MVVIKKGRFRRNLLNGYLLMYTSCLVKCPQNFDFGIVYNNVE